MIKRFLTAALLGPVAVAMFSIASATEAAAATPLCTGPGNVFRGSSGNLAVPVVVSTNDPTCLIGNGLVGSHAAVRILQETFQACFPNQLAPGFSVDGSWGPITRQTLINVQRVINTDGTVAADGIYGPITRNHMRFQSNDVGNRCFHY
jgi:hypothetical protein